MPGICSPTYTLNPYKPVSIEAETPEPKPNIRAFINLRTLL